MSRPTDINPFISRLARRLQVIYKGSFSEGQINRILGWISCCDTGPHTLSSWDERDMVLITYANTLERPGEKPLTTLYRFLHNQLSESVNYVHLLPFFPFTSDDGFSISDFMKVNPAFGDWDDVAAITPEFGLMADLVINHVSTAHPWFRNYLKGQSPGKGYFIEALPGADYSRVVRPRSTPLLEREWLSCTKSRSSPSSAKIWRFQLSRKKPRASPNTLGSRSRTPGRVVSMIFIC